MKEISYSYGSISAGVIGKVTRNVWTKNKSNYILISRSRSFLISGFACVIYTDQNIKKRTAVKNWVFLEKNISDSLMDRDCLHISSDGVIKVLWDSGSNSNSILFTESCNCNCIMCPQPPKKHDPELCIIGQKLIDIIEPTKDQTICITGGEPTLLKDKFFTLLEAIKSKHPNNHTLLLTNGKAFADEKFTKLYANCKPLLMTTCVSLHADTDDIHDMIVQSKGSFYKTLQGLYNLGKIGDRIELRVVINKLNYKRLRLISEFIYKNLPFVYHCAFMGQEITGLASLNKDSIWIDPFDYKDQLSDAVKVLSRADIKTSVYNVPFCLLNDDIWSFARQSISEWKNKYIAICDECKLKKFCAGLFTTSGVHQSQKIQPIN